MKTISANQYSEKEIEERKKPTQLYFWLQLPFHV